MTDQPKTLALDSAEWKALLLSNIVRTHESVNGAKHITPEGLAMFNGHMDRMKGIAAAWHASLPANPAEDRTAPDQPATNGAAKPKGKGGWPKGKKRNAATQQRARVGYADIVKAVQ